MRSLFFILWVGVSSALDGHNLLLRKLEHIRSLEASFQQSVFLNGRQKQRSSGRFSLLRPGKMRWMIDKPKSKLLLADGRNLWIYEPSLQQVTKRPERHGIGGAAGLFLSSAPNLWVQRYKVNVMQAGRDIVFQLSAKKTKSSYKDLRLRFIGDNLKSIEFNDQFGQHSVIELANVQTNKPISNSKFQFQAPKNVDVIALEK